MKVLPLPSGFNEDHPWRRATLIVLLLAIATAVSANLILPRQTQTDCSLCVIDLPTAPRVSTFLGPYAVYAKESDRPIGVAELRMLDTWRPVDVERINFGPVEEPIWLRTRVRNTLAEPIIVRLDTRRVAFQIFEVYVDTGTGSTPSTLLQSTYRHPFDQRPIQHRYLAVDLEIQPEQELDLYVRYLGLYNSVLPIRLARPSAFEAADDEEIFWSAVFYGAIFVMCIMVAVSWPVIGPRMGLAFSYFLISGLFGVLATEGYVDQFLIPEKTEITARLTDVIFINLFVSILVLSSHMFDLRQAAPRFYSLLNWTAGAAVVIGTYHFLVGLPAREWYFGLYYLIRIAALALQLAIAFWALANQRTGALVFAIGATFISTGAMVTVNDVPLGILTAPDVHGGMPVMVQLLVAIEALVFAATIILRLMALRRERDAAISAELVATKEKLRLTEALRESESAFARARKEASVRLERLQSVTHDIAQPLAALRQSIIRTQSSDEKSTDGMLDALDYLEALARKSWNEPSAPAQHLDETRMETFSVKTVMDIVYRMFRDEAAQKGMTLTYRPIDANIQSNPIELMRILSNLVSNALRHSGGKMLSFEARQKGDGLEILVSDDGEGIAEDALERYLKSREKHENSDGAGLGLSTSIAAAKQLGHTLKIESKIGHGTLCRLLI